MIRTAVT